MPSYQSSIPAQCISYSTVGNKGLFVSHQSHLKEIYWRVLMKEKKKKIDVPGKVGHLKMLMMSIRR